MSKFYDAINNGSQVANKRLSVDFYSKVDTFMFCYKKEFAEAKKEDNTYEKEANAINITLFKLLLQWSVTEGNLFVWCFALLMWHLMAHSVNVDCLFLHNIKQASLIQLCSSMSKPRWIKQVSLFKKKMLF
jgi:hypothetical protein